LKRDLIVFGLILLAFYLGAVMTDTRHERNRDEAVSNAIAHCQDARDCDSQKVIDTVQSMADNGHKMIWHKVCWGKEEE
jgi:hypothetical protein